MLSKYKELEDGEFTLTIENGESVSAKAVGQAHLAFGRNFLLLNNVYFISAIRQNLISGSNLCGQYFSISFHNNTIIISRNGLDICHAYMEHRLYVLKLFDHSLIILKYLG